MLLRHGHVDLEAPNITETPNDLLKWHDASDNSYRNTGDTLR